MTRGPSGPRVSGWAYVCLVVMVAAIIVAGVVIVAPALLNG